MMKIRWMNEETWRTGHITTRRIGVNIYRPAVFWTWRPWFYRGSGHRFAAWLCFRAWVKWSYR